LCFVLFVFISGGVCRGVLFCKYLLVFCYYILLLVMF